jgi:uncharacterized metal-binding protein
MIRRCRKPLVYSCSGCSSAAQLANAVALKLDRAGMVEMSCIAGVGGDVPSLVRIAKSGRPIIALDGRALACVRHSLARHGVQADMYSLLSDYGVKKRHHADFDPGDAEKVVAAVRRVIHAKRQAQHAVLTTPADESAAA